MLQLITCFFNPQNYQNIKRNYFEFRESLNCQLTTVELSFTGQFVIPDSLRIAGDENNVMWQKERLLNIAIEQTDADAIAWVDADLLFQNHHWLTETLHKLEQFPVVQLFERVIYLDANRQPVRGNYGDAYAKRHGIKEFSQPGGAWAARREVLQHGLMDHHILGGGDAMQLAAWRGNWTHPMMNMLNTKWKQHHLKCSARLYPLVRNNIGYTSGAVHHLYHGSRQNRRYVERWRYLADHNFNPEQDIRIDDKGLWKWNSDKPEMHQKVRNYFSERREDES